MLKAESGRKSPSSPTVHPYFFVVSNAGSPEVNGVYKNLDENSNDGTLNYKMINSEGRTFKLYRTPSEDATLRYWIIEERNEEYYYMVDNRGDAPPEVGWQPYIAGRSGPPFVTRVAREVELELRTRIELKDSLTTLDLTTEYGEYCSIEGLKRLYRVLWEEQSPEAREAARLATLKVKPKKKKQKVKPKITVIINLGGYVRDESQSFEISTSFDATVHFLKKAIAHHLDVSSGSRIELMLNGNRILSHRASINKLGIRQGTAVFALLKKRGGSGLSQISLPMLSTPTVGSPKISSPTAGSAMLSTSTAGSAMLSTPMSGSSPHSSFDDQEVEIENRRVQGCCIVS